MTERDHPETNEFLRIQNILLVQRVALLLDQSRFFEMFPNEHIKQTVFENTGNKRTLRLEVAQAACLSGTDHPKLRGYRHASERLTFPIYYVEDSSDVTTPNRATSPYGVMEYNVSAPDGRYYTFTSSQYYFDTSGGGYKVEKNICWNDLLKLDEDLDAMQTFRMMHERLGAVWEPIDFVPNPGGQEVVLDPGDYEKLGGLLGLAEQGVLKEVDYKAIKFGHEK